MLRGGGGNAGGFRLGSRVGTRIPEARADLLKIFTDHARFREAMTAESLVEHPAVIKQLDEVAEKRREHKDKDK